jgi:hypothetical protein
MFRKLKKKSGWSQPRFISKSNLSLGQLAGFILLCCVAGAVLVNDKCVELRFIYTLYLYLSHFNF